MRHLLQPRVLQTAVVAAAISSLACYPRVALWLHRPAPVWYLEAVFFVCGIVLWGFVFAWHEPYTGRPAFVFQLPLAPFLAATAAGMAAALASHFWVDPVLRPQFPEEYPPDLLHWAAAALFALAFNQLFLVFAPFDWVMRLTRSRWLAAGSLGALAGLLLLLKIHRLAASVSPGWLTLVLVTRLAAGFLAAWFYQRGGVGLVCWWTFLTEARHLLDFVR